MEPSNNLVLKISCEAGADAPLASGALRHCKLLTACSLPGLGVVAALWSLSCGRTKGLSCLNHPAVSCSSPLQLIFALLSLIHVRAEQLQAAELFTGAGCAQHLAAEPEEIFRTFLPGMFSS